MKTNTYLCRHTIKRGGEYFPPGSPVVITDPDEAEELIAAGAIVELGDYARMSATRRRKTPATEE